MSVYFVMDTGTGISNHENKRFRVYSGKQLLHKEII